MIRFKIIQGKRSKSRENSFQKGDLKYIILDLIKERSRHGYEIMQELEERSSGLYKPSPGAIYPVLQMLEDMGHASSTERDGRKVYSITDQGSQFLKQRQVVTDEVKSKLRFVLSFKNGELLEGTLEELSEIENVLLDKKLLSGSIDKIKRIREVVSKAAQAVKNISNEKAESDG